MEKCKLTNFQFFSLTALFTSGTAILVMASSIVGLAKQDAWISAIITPLLGTFEVWIIYVLGKMYPDMTFIDIMKKLLGKWLGGFFGFGYAFLCLNAASEVSWYMGNFVLTESMPETPAITITIIYSSVLIIACLYGIETIARACEIFIYLVSVLFILTMVLALPKANIENLLPIFEDGVAPSLKGSLFLSGFLTFPSIILFMVYPINSKKPEFVGKSLITGYLWAGFLVFLSVIMPILILGSTITTRSTFPIYLMAKEIDLGESFLRFEIIVAGIWVITLFIRNTLYFYSGVLSFSQLTGFKNYKRLVVPIGLIVLANSESIYKDPAYLSFWDTYVWLPFIATFGLLPFVLLMIAYIKKSLFKKT